MGWTTLQIVRRGGGATIKEAGLNPTVSAQGGRRQNGRRGAAAIAAAALARDPLSREIGAARSLEDRPQAPQAEPAPSRRPKIVQRVDDPSPEKANAQALEDLAHGAEGLAIVFEGASNAFGSGLPASQEALATALRDVPLMRTHLRMDVHPHSRVAVDWLVQILGARRVSPERLDISFGLDPAAIFAGSGRLRMSIEAMLASMPQSLAHFFALGVPGILLEADGRVFHNAGATDAQELGIMLASALTYLRMFEDARQPVLYAAAHVGFAVALGQDHRRSIAKLRALDRLWARVLESYAVPPAGAVVHAETSYRMLTSRAADTNLARATLAAMAAADAGVATISVLPASLPFGLPDAQSRRAARNTLLVLGNEGDLAPADISPGGVVDALASGLVESAWEELQRIEKEGGVLRSIQAGHIQARIAEARQALAESVREGAARIVGTTLHATPRSGRRPTPPVSSPALTEDGVAFCERLPIIRLEELLDDPR